LDFNAYRNANQFFNNKARMRPLSDYFTYAHASYVPATVFYPAEQFKDIRRVNGSTAAKHMFDLSLFESRTAF